MSNVGDALTGSGGSGVTDPTGSSSFGDTPNLTDSDFAGLTDADIMGGSGGGPSEFSQFSDLTNALSSGSPVGSSVGAQSASMTPPGTAAATGGDPIGATGGTQSNTTPGSTPNQNQQQQGGGGGQHDPDHAPPTAVAELKTLLKGLSGQPTGPTGQTPQGGQAQPFALPTLAAGQTGARSPQMSLPALAAGQTGGQSPGSFYGTSVQPQTTGVNDIVGGAGGANPADAAIPPGAAQQRTAAATADDGAPAVDAQGNPVTAAGTPAADTPTPPPRPGANISADAGGRQINVRKGGGASSAVATGDLPTRVPHPAAALPTHKPGASAAPATGPATSGILNDITGASTGSPTALADLAQAAKTLLPIVLPLLMGGMGGGRRFGRFHGGRFTHGVGRGGFNGFRGGMNAMNYHGGQHPAGRGAWPYHHPQFGWHMHGRPPGPGWLPLHPMDAQSIVGGGQDQNQDPNAPVDPNNPPQEKTTGQPDADFQKSGFSANPFVDALVKQESGGGQNIVSKTDKDSQGRTLAQGGNPNEISQGYFQIQNHPGGTWDTYARQAGVDINKYPTPRSAPLDVQWQVAQKIPIGQWGPATKAILRQKFGAFDPNMPFGQVAAQYGPADGRLAAATPSRKQPAWAKSAPSVAAIPNTVPVTSQPQVAGGP